MTEGEEERPTRPGVPRQGDEESDYSKGYEDGAKGALHDILAFVARGHSASEVRLLAETRLAHIEEETDHRRKRFLPPPRRIALDTLLQVRVKGTRAAPASPLPPAIPGYSYLFLENVPTLARAFLGQVLVNGMPLVALTRHPQELLRMGQDRRFLVLSIGGTVDGEKEDSLSGLRHEEADAGSLSSLIVRFQDQAGGQAGCYLEAFEFLVTEWGFDHAIRFVHWLNTAVQRSNGVLVLSADPDSLDQAQLSSLKKDFSILRP